MASDPSTSRAHVHRVTVDASQNPLTVSRQRLDLKSGDIVVWDFVNLQEGWTPSIHFHDDHRQGLGSFVVLRQSMHQVWGQGSDGDEQERTYQAVITPPEGDSADSEARSNEATVRIGGEPNSSPIVIVTPNLEDNTFEVNLDSVTRLGGDCIFFRFAGLTPNQVPTLQFHTETLNVSPTPQPSQHLGPFGAFCRDVDTIIAEGSNGRHGKFEYDVVVAELLGDGSWQEKKLKRSPDPFVYSEEDPIDPDPI